MNRFFLMIVFCCLAVTSLGQTKTWVVASDGSGRFRTIQAALDAIPRNNKKPVRIYVKNGIYEEKLQLDSGKMEVTLAGEHKFRTILRFNDHSGKITAAGDTINTYTSQSFRILGAGFRAENMTFENTAGFNAGQAVAVQVAADRAQFINCRFLGHQDVLFTVGAGNRMYFEHCYIEGTTDFIFGNATAWFEGCQIHSKKNSHLTAASTPKEQVYGYVFNDCMLTADTGLLKVSLGRPWRPYSSVTYLHCYIDRHILATGWDNWKNPANELTARYSEYENFGPGAGIARRVSWSHQLTLAEAESITKKKVLRGWRVGVK